MMEEPWRIAYAEILRDLAQNPLPYPWYEQSMYRPMYLAFSVYDINGSGIPELFITIGTHYRELMKVFTFSDDTAVSLAIPPRYIFGDSFLLPADNGLGIITYGWHATGSFWISRLMIDEGRLIAEDELAFETGGAECLYFINRVEVTEAEFNSMYYGIVGTWDERQFITQHKITEENIRNIIFGYISQSITSSSVLPVETAPMTAQILLNGKAISLTGYTIEGRNYFPLSDIAYILQDTRAQFYFIEDRSNFSTSIRVDRLSGWDWNFRYSDIIERQSASNSDRATLHPSVLYPIDAFLHSHMILGSTHGDSEGVFVNAFGTEYSSYFALEDLSGFLSFFIDHATNGSDTIIIDTNEPTISEYGRRVAEDFLMQRPTIFHPYPWSEEILAIAESWDISDISSRRGQFWDAVAFPSSFKLHDLRGNGIPDIFLYQENNRREPFVIYSYFDGGYRRIGAVSQHGEMFHDRQGRIFFLEGAHSMGFLTMRILTFLENDVEWEVLYSPHWFDADYISERSRLFWEGGYWTELGPVMPDNPNEPLTTNRFLRDLTRCISETIEQMLMY